MSRSPIHNLRADDLGRFLLDLHTPVERTVGRMFGCFTKLAVAISIVLFISVMGSDSGGIAKLLRIAGLFMMTGFFFHCKRNIDCYYVLDDVGGQLLYHFSAIMIVSEDPVANLEDVAGVGVSYAGRNSGSGADSWAVVFCLSDGRIIRVSDFFEHTDQVNAIASDVAELIKVPCATCNYGERKIITLENGLMIQKKDDSYVSSVSKDQAAGCLVGLLVAPYAFYPTLIVLTLGFMIVGGVTTEQNIEYYREQNNYAFIEADGTVLPQLHKNRRSGPASRPGQPVAVKSSDAGAHKASKSVEKPAAGSFVLAEEIASAEITTDGTIIPGVGISGLVQIDEEMHVVLNRLNRPVPVVEVPDRVGFDKKLNKYIARPQVREDILDGAVSIVFEPDRQKKMRVTRIEIFRGNELPNKTPSGIGFGASAKKLFDLAEGDGSFGEREGPGFKDRTQGASFFTAHGPRGKEDGIEFKTHGIAYLFSGDRLTEIVITRRWK